MCSLSPSGTAVETAIRLSLLAFVGGMRVCVAACVELVTEVSIGEDKSPLTYLEGLFEMAIGPGYQRYVFGWFLASRSRCGVK